MAELDLYQKRVNSCKTKLPCSLCSEILLPKSLEEHCKSKHGLNRRKCCIWCIGEYTWEKRSKKHHVKHLTECFNIAIRKQVAKIDSTVTYIESLIKPHFDIVPMCPERNFFEQQAPLPNLPQEAYEHMNLLPEGWKSEPNLTFMGNIQLAIDYVKLFLNTPYKWYHTMVSAIAVPSFIEAMKTQQSNVFTLPFWCWCNGGKHADPYKRQHRHIIVISKKNYFLSQVWPRVAIPEDESAPFHFKCKRFKKIETWLHLVNTIGYVSKRESKCQFPYIKENRVGNKSNHHFYIATSLPKIFNYCVATQVGDNALLEILRFQFMQLSLDPFLDKVFHEKQSWYIHIRDISSQLYTVLPVEKHWEPGHDASSNAYMYLLEGKKLYFHKNQSMLDWTTDQWTHHQMEKGNCFCINIGKIPWKFPSNQQKQLNTIHRLKEKNNQEMENLRNELEERKRREIEMFKSQIKHLEADKEYFKNRTISGEEIFQREMKRLEEENKFLKEEIKRLHETIYKRGRKMNAQSPD